MNKFIMILMVFVLSLSADVLKQGDTDLLGAFKRSRPTDNQKACDAYNLFTAYWDSLTNFYSANKDTNIVLQHKGILPRCYVLTCQSQLYTNDYDREKIDRRSIYPCYCYDDRVCYRRWEESRFRESGQDVHIQKRSPLTAVLYSVRTSEIRGGDRQWARIVEFLSFKTVYDNDAMRWSGFYPQSRTAFLFTVAPDGSEHVDTICEGLKDIKTSTVGVVDKPLKDVIKIDPQITQKPVSPKPDTSSRSIRRVVKPEDTVVTQESLVQSVRSIKILNKEYASVGGDMLFSLIDAAHKGLIDIFKTGMSKDYLKIPTWPDGVIPYVISGSFSEDDLIAIKRAMISIEFACGVKFVKSDAKSGSVYKIKRVDTGKFGGCSTLGYCTRSLCLFTTRSPVTVGLAMHEFMHGIGMIHEHERSIRDRYIRIHTSNIIPEDINQFDRLNCSWVVGRKEIRIDTLPYNFHSIMHYDSLAFSRNDKPSITAKVSGVEFGQCDSLSVGDRKVLSAVYGKTKKGFIDVLLNKLE